MGFFSWIIVGLIGGILGKLFHPGDDGNGLFKTIILGVLGGWLGGFLGSQYFGMSMTGVNFESIGISAVGSVVVLAIRRALQSRKKSS
jgi:uncharacterized membrane protein YeaQ/YmgE (transglycosylase-associated protein family)